MRYVKGEQFKMNGKMMTVLGFIEEAGGYVVAVPYSELGVRYVRFVPFDQVPAKPIPKAIPGRRYKKANSGFTFVGLTNGRVYGAGAEFSFDPDIFKLVDEPACDGEGS